MLFTMHCRNHLTAGECLLVAVETSVAAAVVSQHLSSFVMTMTRGCCVFAVTGLILVPGLFDSSLSVFKEVPARLCKGSSLTRNEQRK